MKTEDEKLDMLLCKLRQSQPLLHDADLLTDHIMQEIHNRPVQKTSYFLTMVRILSSSAAAFLIGLFIFQQTETKPLIAENTSTPIVEVKTPIHSIVIDSLTNKPSSLMKTYFCYLKQNAHRKKPFSKLIQTLN